MRTPLSAVNPVVNPVVSPMGAKLLPPPPVHGRRSFGRCFVHGIPAEVLTEIFLFVRDNSAFCSTSSTSDHGPVYAGNLALLCVTAVCPRWRLVATNFSILWNNIAFSTLKISSIQCAELFLGRTKGCILRIYISAPALLDTPVILIQVHRLLFKISSESHRVRVLDLLATPRTSVLYAYWANPRTNQRWIPRIDDVTASSCGAFPLVESMRLSSPSWYPVAPCLKNLDLRSNGNGGSLSSLLHALGGCPALEILTLQGFRRFIDEDSFQAPATTLSKLHRLHIFFCNSAPILAFLQLPSLTHPLVIFDSDPREGLLRCLPQGRPGVPYLEGVSKLNVVLNMRNSQYSVAAYREDGRMKLYLGVSMVSHQFRWQWIRGSMEAVASSDPLSETTAMSITTDVIFTPWSPWLSKMRRLSRLDLCCPDIMGYLGTLSTSVGGSPLCPTLRTLALRRFQRSDELDYACLKACILFRREAGCPLTSVLVPGDEWTRVRARDASWSALVDSQVSIGDRSLLQLSREE